jgi:hypothetical protein
VKPGPPSARNHPKVNRRAVLRGGALAALLPGVPAGAALLPLTACTSEEPPPGPDPLADLAEQARTDAAAAEAVATSVPDLAETATVVAKSRAEHASVLQREVDRLRPLAEGATTAPPPPPAKPSVPSGAAAAKASLVEALRTAERQAADLVPGVARYRAGMLGSIAAGCASLREVLG